MTLCIASPYLITHSRPITELIHGTSVFRVDSPVPDVSYCLCPTKRLPRREEGWEAYVERKDILVWRREHTSKRGLYEYKLYGKFDDVTVLKKSSKGGGTAVKITKFYCHGNKI